MELRKKIEALLFSSGKRMHIIEIAKLCNAPPDRTRAELINLAADYGARESSLAVQNDGEYWKLATKQDYTNVVKSFVKETELSKTLMETLATIAFKYPIKQADLIRVRTNKAYDHLMELEKMGYITRQKYGRTKLIKLTEKFFNYFNLQEESLKDKFKDFQSLADAIEGKEKEIEKINDEQKKKAEEAKKDKEQLEKEVDLIDDEGHKVKLEVVDEPEESEKPEEEQEEAKVEEYTEKVGDLEVVDEEQGVEETVSDVLGADEGGEAAETEDVEESITKAEEAQVEESAAEVEEAPEEAEKETPVEEKKEGAEEEKEEAPEEEQKE